MRARAHQSHEIPTRLPLHIRRGDRLDVGERSDEWPAFVFVSSPDGSGWVPSRYLDMDAGGAVAVRDYDTTELPVSSGQEVAVIKRDDRSGWWWCRSEGGREGWVPVGVLTEVG